MLFVGKMKQMHTGEGWRSVLTDPKNEDDNANLVSYTLVSFEEEYELNDT